jgi:TRAP transporter TAXI family solute receptor
MNILKGGEKVSAEILLRGLVRGKRTAAWMSRQVAVAGILTILIFASGTQAAEVISIGTGPTGGPWYACGGTLAEIFSSEVEGVKASAEVTGSAVMNMKLLGAGDVQMGFTINTIAKMARDGKPPFKEESPGIRTILSSFNKGYLQVFTLAGSDLEYISQLKGRTVVPGPKGHGSLIRLREVFKVLGFAFDDIKPVYLPYSQALAALGDGKVEAVVLYVAAPAPVANQFSMSNDIRLLRLRDDEIDAMRAAYPHYERLVIPRESYRGQEQEVPTVGTPNGLYGSADLDEELVYRMVKAIYENIEKFRACHPSVKNHAVELAPLGSLVPFHPGAIRYYKEAGVWPGE